MTLLRRARKQRELKSLPAKPNLRTKMSRQSRVRTRNQMRKKSSSNQMTRINKTK